MAATTTISVSISTDLSITLSEYLEETKMTRSALVSTALNLYLNGEKNEKESVILLEELNREIKEIKEIISKK